MTDSIGTKEMLIDRFSAMKPDVTPDDKKEAERALLISHVTVYNYLNGDVKNIDLAVRLLEFFQERINRRNDRIRAIA